MKQKLPQPNVNVIALFPKNLRFITEYTFTEAQSHNIKVLLVSAVSIFLLSLIFLEGITIWANLRQQEILSQQRVQLQHEVTYWEGVASKYQGYRDVYYRIAALQYKLGNIGESQKYIKKALELDPNFPEGHVLGAHVGL
ncbi:MAG TPA: tetratricopeptide repeat protein [Candidatus Acidoferrales bacterium]|nr:tetratricopeptide repeat protein [Candidatus Acidoferrales bacterium]